MPLSINKDIYVTIPQGQYNNLKITTVLQQPLIAPIKKDQNVGELAIKLNNDSLLKQPLMAMHSVAKGGLWSRVSDAISLSIHNIFYNEDTTVVTHS